MRQPAPPDETAFLASMASRYVWDKSVADALVYPDRIIHRVMDLGTLNDVLALERMLGRTRLAAALRCAPIGAMRPRSWWFWHYRLDLADEDHDPPAMPTRRLA